MEVTQSNVYHENSNPVLRDFLTVVLNEKHLLDQFYQQAVRKWVGYQDLKVIVFNLCDSQFYRTVNKLQWCWQTVIGRTGYWEFLCISPRLVILKSHKSKSFLWFSPTHSVLHHCESKYRSDILPGFSVFWRDQALKSRKELEIRWGKKLVRV